MAVTLVVHEHKRLGRAAFRTGPALVLQRAAFWLGLLECMDDNGEEAIASFQKVIDLGSDRYVDHARKMLDALTMPKTPRRSRVFGSVWKRVTTLSKGPMDQ
ncbi:hypothetical protein GCM10022224_025560 [Nonomuraea antimicrobica]|uniref:Transcriptional activator domain-containing protein n=1 Tax=Nonomuraea antimicrobica TaxID=561173 RepID=A0ABP7BHR1_9ACTN